MKNSFLIWSCHWKSIKAAKKSSSSFFLLKYEKSLKLFAHSQHICILNAQRMLSSFVQWVCLCVFIVKKQATAIERIWTNGFGSDVIWMRKKSKRWKCLFFVAIDFPLNIWHNCLFFCALLHFQGFFFWWWWWWWWRNDEVKFESKVPYF